MKFIRRTVYSCLLLLLGIVGLLYFLFNTTAGLNTLIKVSTHYLPGTLKVRQVNGRLLNHFSIAILDYHHKNVHLKAENLSFDWQIIALKQHQLLIAWHKLQWQDVPNNSLSSIEGKATLTGTLPHIDVEIDSKIKSNAYDTRKLHSVIAGVFPWQWTINATLSQPLNLPLKQEGLHAQVTLKAEIQNINKGDFTLTIPQGYYQMAQKTLVPLMSFQGGILKGKLTDIALTGDGSFALDAEKKISITFNLPNFKLNKGFAKTQPIQAEFGFLYHSFDFLTKLSPEISNPAGHLDARLQASGTLAKMVFSSTIHLSKARLSLPRIGLDLNAIDLSIKAHERHWEAQGLIHSGNQSLQLAGKGMLDATLQGELAISGNEFSLVNTKEYQIRISPQLKVKINPKTLDISGTILVPFAQIKPQSFSNSLTISDDVVFASQKNDAPAQNPFNTSMNIAVVMGDDVALTYKGLQATLMGTVQLHQTPQGPINAVGELNVKQGQYKAYGQDLAIEHGELVFTGGQLNNPGVNLRAEKKIETTTSTPSNSSQLLDFNSNNLKNANIPDSIRVGVEVTGKLSQPKIQLYSIPAVLSQADALSMLVLGRPASEANKAGGQLLLAAISSTDLGSGSNASQLIEQLKQNIGFDFNMQTNSNYNLNTNQMSDTTSLVVGKSLSKRIYVSYNVGLSQADPNVLTLKYLLNKFLSIQVSSSDTGNGIDILYTSTKLTKDKS